MAFILPPYMQEATQQPSIMSGQRKGTSRTAPQSMSSLLGIFNQMPQFQAKGIGEEKIRDLFGGAVGAARTFGMEQNRATAGERGAAPVSSGVAQQKATRLGLFTQAPMIEAILKDLGGTNLATNSYLAQLLGQLMQSASGPISEASEESTTWRAPTGAEINPQTPRVEYPSQGRGGGGGGRGGVGGSALSNDDWWSRTGAPGYGSGGGAYTTPLMSDEGIGSDYGYRAPGGVSLPRTPQPQEQWATGGGLGGQNIWNMPQELMSGAGLPQTSGGDDYWANVAKGSMRDRATEEKLKATGYRGFS